MVTNYCLSLNISNAVCWSNVPLKVLVTDQIVSSRHTINRQAIFSNILLIDIGFEVPDIFVVGYALDYNEYFRDLNVSRSASFLSYLYTFIAHLRTQPACHQKVLSC